MQALWGETEASSTGTCRLCGEKRKLLESHVIPKFVIEWLKETSATGFIRQAINLNKRSQDIQKIRLLCSECEVRFSRWEKEFAERVFYPFHQGTLGPLEYDTWLLKFIISVSWRGFVASRHLLHDARFHSWDRVAQAWEEYLLDNATSPGPNTHHLFLPGAISEADIGLPQGWNFYRMRSIDMTPVYSQTEGFMYTSLPGVILCSWFEPADPLGWINTKVEPRGKLVDPQVVHHQGFCEFALHKAGEATGLGTPLSQRQRETISRTLEKDPQRLAQSETLRAILLDQRLTEEGRKGKRGET